VKSPPPAATTPAPPSTVAPPTTDLAGAPDAGSSNEMATESDASTPGPPSLIALPTAAAQDVIIYDPSATPSPRVKWLVARDRLPRAERKQILDRLLRRYLNDAKQCTYNTNDLARSREAGDFVPEPAEVATGAFTAARAFQKLYLVTNGECGASHADNFGSVTLAVFEGDTVVAQANTWGGSAIQDVMDLDGDGKSEILLSSGFTNMGETMESVKLVRFEGTDIVTVKDFGKGYEDECGTGGNGAKTRRYTVIRAVVRPGAPIKFGRESKHDSCP